MFPERSSLTADYLPSRIPKQTHAHPLHTLIKIHWLYLLRNWYSIPNWLTFQRRKKIDVWVESLSDFIHTLSTLPIYIKWWWIFFPHRFHCVYVCVCVCVPGLSSILHHMIFRLHTIDSFILSLFIFVFIHTKEFKEPE